MKKVFKKTLILALIFVFGFIGGYFYRAPQPDKIENDTITAAGALIGMEFTRSEKELMIPGIWANLESYNSLRRVNIKNSTPPAVQFNPVPVGFEFKSEKSEFKMDTPEKITIPENRNDLAFYSVNDLGFLLKNRMITSTELTKIYLKRLKKHDKELRCVITLTEELALKQAAKADFEIEAGNYRGPLHGIPYGVKDLLTTKGYKATWGAEPYKNQMINKDATVVKKLEDAGAVLVAKLSLGALAWGDVWFDAQTKNPWNPEQGSSGSSAGPASATSAGLVAFSIGSETWGSIVSPSTRCGTSGLRPTYGRVSRTGAMALSWTMDKLGPICRSVEDCALVFNAIYGPDGTDQTLVDAPFVYDSASEHKNVKIGYVKSAFEEDNDWKEFDAKTLKVLEELGYELVPLELPELPVESIAFILNAEAAAAFDTLTRSGEDDKMVRQIPFAWPNVFRVSRFIPAVEYIQANRLRYKIIQEMSGIFKKVDLYVCPSFGGNNLLLTNLTGHPSVVLPNGFTKENTPVSITFIGNLFDEGKLLRVSEVYQEATGFHLKHPPKFVSK